MSQLALPLKLQDYAVFDSFWPAQNAALVAYLSDVAQSRAGPGGWIWGAPATGKTHLLQAVCERVGDQAVYLPLKLLKDDKAGALDGLSSRHFVCLDDVDAVAGKQDWEFALFELCNGIADAGGVLIAAAATTSRESGFALADLQSRFSMLATYQIRVLGESDRIKALQLRARHRGLDLPVETASYMLSRRKRDMTSLYRLLDELDSASLQAKRRLTVPFVKEVITRIDAKPEH